MARLVGATVVLILISAAQVHAQDGRLQAVRNDVRSASDSGGTSNSPASNDSDGPLADFLSGLFFAQDSEGNTLGVTLLSVTVLAPFIVPAAILQDDYKYHLYFAPHPYAQGYRGYQLLSPAMAEMMNQDAYGDISRRPWSVRLWLEDGNDFRGLNRLGGSAKIEHESRWGVITNWNWLHERLPCGCIDETVIGDTNVTFRFAQNEIASMYTGIGFRVLTDRRQTDWGFNFTYGGDWFPMRPFVVSAVFDAGSLGHAGVIHARGTVGAIFRGWEVFAGYDFLRIGGTNLQGPMAGVRWWF